MIQRVADDHQPILPKGGFPSREAVERNRFHAAEENIPILEPACRRQLTRPGASPDFDAESQRQRQRVALMVRTGEEDGLRRSARQEFFQRGLFQWDRVAHYEAGRCIEGAAAEVRLHGGIIGLPEGEAGPDHLVFKGGLHV